MAVNYTADQRAAIDSRGRRLIVSAAAGSGKTAVLVDRVVGLVCDTQNPVDIDRLLVVTFTNAAAAEMRGRIADALTERLAHSPTDRRLRRQLALLGEARIQTVHAFCQELLRRNFALAGLSPDFTLLDEAGAQRLKDQAMESLLEAEYEADTAAFRALRENLCEERGDYRLQQAIRGVYDKLRSHPEPGVWLRYMAKQAPLAPEQTGWGRYVLEQAADRMAYGQQRLAAARQALSTVPEVEEKYAPVFDSYLLTAARLREALAQGWDDAHAVLAGFEKQRMPSAPRGADKAFTGRMKAARDSIVSIIEDLRDGSLSQGSEAVMAQEARVRPLAAELCRLVEGYTETYDALKAGQEALDFSDLEHRALALLRTPEGGRTALAEGLSQELAEVLVDEYQDTNEIQERIFEALTPEAGSAFFVGDIKQSIYRFRLADPDIFLDRLDSSPPLEADSQRASIALRSNFRSLPAVIDLCNWVSSRLMSRSLGGVDYGHDHRLEAGREGDGGPCELWIMEAEGLRDDDEDSEEKAALEARLAADRIAEILNDGQVLEPDGGVRPARPDDCAILLSSFSSKAAYYSRALARAGIPVQSPDEEDFFGAIEVSVIISLLRIVDNRRQDIPLIAVLRSPLFAFDADALAAVRLAAPGADFCTALEAAAQGGDRRCADFLATLESFAQASLDMGVAQLLRYLYRETGAQGVFVALDDASSRLARLEALYQAALSFEASGARGLYRFLVWLDERMAAGEAPAPARTGGGVQLMSIHKSKGLEFPFVILPDLAKAFNTDDSKGPVLFHQHLGIGMSLREPALRAEYKTVAQQAIGGAIRREGLSEELRKLYVAMTRARQKLILIMSLRNAPKHMSAWAEEAAGPTAAPQFLAGQSGAAPWLCAALLNHPAADPLRALCDTPPPVGGGTSPDRLLCKVIHWQDIPQPRYSPAVAPSTPQPDLTPHLALLDREYPHAAASALPSKLTPTGVKRLVPDAGEIAGVPGGADVRMYRTVTADSSLSAAGRGSAIHAYLRHMDYRACGDRAAVEADILRVAMAGWLDADEARAVGRDMVAALGRSELAGRINRADKVLREYEFSALFTPHELLQNGMEDEHILLNGAIDLMIFGQGGVEVVDFKSDAINPGFEARQAEKHRLQLSLYAAAAEKIFGLPVVAQTVYFLATGGEAAL